MNLRDQQRIYLQTIFDYFHEKAEWPTYRHVDQKLLSIDPTIDINIESPMRGPTAVLISCKSNNDQARLKDMENLSDVSHKVSKLLPA
jgi:hypothetical protein